MDAGTPTFAFRQGLLLMLKALTLWASCDFLFLSFVLVPPSSWDSPSLFAHVASFPFSKQILWIQVLPAQYPAGGVCNL